MVKLISVVIPAYNAERYLTRCLNCVRGQTYRELEIIVVDDGSADNTGVICADTGKQDARIKVIKHPANEGLSAARNSGLRAARGEYIHFLDADDFIYPDYYEKLWNVAVKTGAELTCGGYYNEKYPTHSISFAREEILTISKDKQALNRDVHMVAWFYLYKKEFLDKHGLIFDRRLRVGAEDVLFTPRAAYYAKKIALVPGAAYIHTRNPGSIMNSNEADIKETVEKNTDYAVKKIREFARDREDWEMLSLLPVTYTDDENTLLSVIIPVYNADRYLSACLDSVLGQTLKEIEIICINDGSTDNSAAILQAYAAKFPQIRVVPQENAGSGAARNKGLLIAQGRYVAFVGADDYLLEPAALEKMVALAEENTAKMVCANFKNDENGELKDNRYVRRYSGKEKLLPPEDYDIPWYFFRSIYRKSFLIREQIWFPDYLVGEDVIFLARVLIKVGQIYILPLDFYAYRIAGENKINTKPKMLAYIKHFIAVSEILNEPGFYNMFSRYERWLYLAFLWYIPGAEWFSYVREACDSNGVWIRYFEHFLMNKTKEETLKEQATMIQTLSAKSAETPVR
ncbi:MAG: glycosyltransferase [Candidatus Margulisbacteria bacterium]|jgi:glycosyltransferase involved in cell wall biosynthesis|nr:glycosyltransferase [Candidatus Margulisiibacteriota bacterium]